MVVMSAKETEVGMSTNDVMMTKQLFTPTIDRVFDGTIAPMTRFLLPIWVSDYRLSEMSSSLG